MERSVLFGLSILTGSSSSRFHRRARSLRLHGAVLSNGSNSVPGLDGVEHALADLLGVNLQDLNSVLLDEGKGRCTREDKGEVKNREDSGRVAGFCKSGPWDVKSRRWWSPRPSCCRGGGEKGTTHWRRQERLDRQSESDS
ncbi:WPP domain-containing protein 2-like [Pyrus ussuriensis x Pyrus communis]|uniref:WPP domain-containing protein 2-like n=1 Tax=Pyrus ussuriensis x Pyrus communis TaxID=2448454 RepID=A0A5N5HTB1_9ROSA|nr:WPP domain-containing protein 2-like [Pyrus ussuriensis x Pyrus communis]